MHSNINGYLKTFIFWKEILDLIINLKKPLHENINDGSLPFFSLLKKENNSSKQLPKQFTCSLLLMCSLCLSSKIFTEHLSFLPFLVLAFLLAPPSRVPYLSPMLRCLCYDTTDRGCEEPQQINILLRRWVLHIKDIKTVIYS